VSGLEGLDVCELVWSLLAADNGVGGVNRLLGGTATTTGRIYRDRVPAAAILPAATVALVAHVDTNTLGGVRAFAVAEVDVRVVGDGSSYGTIGPIAERADTVLQSAGGGRDQSYVYKLRRTAVQAFPEDDAGKTYTHLIQTYRTEAESTAD